MDAESDNATELFETLSVICEGEPAADVMWALALMIARGIRQSATDKNPDATFALLRESVDLELSRYRPVLVSANQD